MYMVRILLLSKTERSAYYVVCTYMWYAHMLNDTAETQEKHWVSIAHITQTIAVLVCSLELSYRHHLAHDLCVYVYRSSANAAQQDRDQSTLCMCLCGGLIC